VGGFGTEAVFAMGFAYLGSGDGAVQTGMRKGCRGPGHSREYPDPPAGWD